MTQLNGGKFSRASRHGDHTDSLNPSLDYHDDSYNDVYSSYFLSEGGPSGPGWRKRISQGQAVTSGITGWKQVFYYTPGYGRSSFRYSYPYTSLASESVTTDSGFLTGIPYTLDPGGFSVADVDDRAIMKLVGRLQDAKSQLMGLVVLGELGETLHMIRRPAAALRSGLNAYHADVLKRIQRGRVTPSSKKGRAGVSRVGIIRDIVANTWLEYSFGWKPLVQDLQDAGAAVAKLTRPNLNYQVVTGKAEKETLDSDQITEGNAFSGKIRLRTKGIQRVKVKYTALIAVKLDAAGIPDISETLGADWSSILPAAWELIPYSFLVDYFTNIGDLISAISFPSGFVNWVVRNQLQEFESSITSVGFTAPPDSTTPGISWSMSGSYGSTVRSYRMVNRSAFTGPLIPNFVVRMPGAGSTRWLNIAALAAMRKIPGLRALNPNSL